MRLYTIKLKFRIDCLMLVLLLLPIIAFSVSFTSPVSAVPPATGDWIITGTESLQNQVLLLNGSIVIQSGGRLELNNVTVIFMLGNNTASSGQFNITVMSDGELILNNVTILTDSASQYSYMVANPGSLLVLNGVVFKRFGYVNQPGIKVLQPIVGSIFNDVFVEAQDSLSSYAIYVEQAFNLSLNDLHLLNGAGLLIFNSTNIVVENTVLNSKGLLRAGLLVQDVQNITVRDVLVKVRDGDVLGYGIAFSGNVSGICENSVITSESSGRVETGIYSRARALNGSTLLFRNIDVNVSLKGIFLEELQIYGWLAENNWFMGNTIRVSDPSSGVGILYRSSARNYFLNNTVQSKSRLFEASSPSLRGGMTIIAENYFMLDVTDASQVPQDPLISINSPNIHFENNTIGSSVTYPRAMEIRNDNVTASRNVIQNVSSVAIEVMNARNVTIQGHVIAPYHEYGIITGMNVTNVNASKIIGNSINSTFNFGMWINNSRDLIIQDNLIANSREVALHLGHSSNVSVNANTIVKGFDRGVEVMNSFLVSISDNIIKAHQIKSLYITDSNNVTVNDNIIDAEGGFYAAYLRKTMNYTITGNSFTNSSYTIVYLMNSDLGRINDNILVGIFQPQYGIFLGTGSDNNSILTNIISGVDQGIYIYGMGNLISGNDLSYCRIGINIFGSISMENMIKKNFLRYCRLVGIDVDGAQKNQIEENVVLNGGYGIRIRGVSWDNVFSYNSLAHNDVGVFIADSNARGNIVHHNDFISNDLQAWDNSGPSINHWNESERGNYWSDYTGPNDLPPYEVGDVPYNITGSIADFYPLVESPNRLAPPRITSPSDIVYYQGETGHVIRWNAYDSNPDRYSITRNGTIIRNGAWDGLSPIEVNVDGLDVGVWVFELVVNDTDGRSVSDTVMVTVLPSLVVDITPPVVSHPADVTLRENETVTLTWAVNDDNPATYQIFINGSLVVTNSWQNGDITFTIDPQQLNMSANDVYNVTIVVKDSFGNQIKDTVMVTVLPAASGEQEGTTTTEPQGEELVQAIADNPGVLVLGMVLGMTVLLLLLGIVKIIRRRRGP